MPAVPRVLMCPPDFYGIEYEINPWMSRSRGSTPEQARRQWQALRDLLVGLGVTVELLEPRQGLPDLVFTANAGLVFGKRFFSSRFRHEVRARETPYYEAWFANHGFAVECLPECRLQLEKIHRLFFEQIKNCAEWVNDAIPLSRFDVCRVDPTCVQG